MTFGDIYTSRVGAANNQPTTRRKTMESKDRLAMHIRRLKLTLEELDNLMALDTGSRDSRDYEWILEHVDHADDSLHDALTI